jgi:hypothetical protein
MRTNAKHGGAVDGGAVTPTAGARTMGRIEKAVQLAAEAANEIEGSSSTHAKEPNMWLQALSIWLAIALFVMALLCVPQQSQVTHVYWRH